MANLLEDHAKELCGVGEGYHCSVLQALHATKNRPEGTRVELMQAPLLADGKIAWKYADKSTRKVIDIPDDDHRAWVAEWERKTGLCATCDRKRPGFQNIGWSAAEGVKHRVCPKCKGTGKTVTESSQATA